MRGKRGLSPVVCPAWIPSLEYPFGGKSCASRHGSRPEYGGYWQTDNQVAVVRPRSPFLAKNVYDCNIQIMLNWGQVKGFDWDSGTARKSADKHGVSQAEAEQVFFNKPLLLVPDPEHSGDEQRYHALGRTDEGRTLHVTFTLRVSGTLIRVISARDMHRKERIFYEQASKART
jgi:uncharacterized protein